MKIIFDINTDNAAFEGRRMGEVRRIVKEAVSKVPADGLKSYAVTVRDINGNTVGTMTVLPDESKFTFAEKLGRVIYCLNSGRAETAQELLQLILFDVPERFRQESTQALGEIRSGGLEHAAAILKTVVRSMSETSGGEET